MTSPSESTEQLKKILAPFFNNAFEDGEDGEELRNPKLADEYSTEAAEEILPILAQEYSRGAEDIIRKIQHELKVEGYGKSLEQIVEAIRVEKLKEPSND